MRYAVCKAALAAALLACPVGALKAQQPAAPVPATPGAKPEPAPAPTPEVKPEALPACDSEAVVGDLKASMARAHMIIEKVEAMRETARGETVSCRAIGTLRDGRQLDVIFDMERKGDKIALHGRTEPHGDVPGAEAAPRHREARHRTHGAPRAAAAPPKPKPQHEAHHEERRRARPAPQPRPAQPWTAWGQPWGSPTPPWLGR